MRRKVLNYTQPVKSTNLLASLTNLVVGQDDALKAIVPHVQMYNAGLAPPGRPAGIFLLLGPTGTGKTKTVEAFAEAIHGNAKSVLTVHCGEYQASHETSKLIGAPPGYLGHRETKAAFNGASLKEIRSVRSGLAVVLFDEIEKAHHAVMRVLLGVLDKGTLRLGDGEIVNFTDTLIFMTSNLGAKAMSEATRAGFGFERPVGTVEPKKLDSIAHAAAKRHFSPEFMNRIDVVTTYHSLGAATLGRILDLEIAEFQRMIITRLGTRFFTIDVTNSARELLLEHGTSAEYGARELKRAMQRLMIQPIAAMLEAGEIEAGDKLLVKTDLLGKCLRFKTKSAFDTAVA